MVLNMNRDTRKTDFCICENKDADQLRRNRKADQRLCFRYTDSTIPLLPISKISSLLQASVIAQPGLCGTWSETPKTGFLRTRLISSLAPCHSIKVQSSYDASLLLTLTSNQKKMALQILFLDLDNIFKNDNLDRF